MGNLWKIWEEYGRIIYKWRFQGGKDIELNGGSFFRNSWDFMMMNRDLTNENDQIWGYSWEFYNYIRYTLRFNMV